MVAGINIDVVDDVGKIQERVTTLDLASSPTITLVAGRVYNVTAWYWVPKSVQITVPLVFNPDTTQLVIDVALSAPPVGSTWWAIIDISLRVSAIW